MLLLATLPLIFIILLLIVLRWSFYKTAPVVFTITTISAFLGWELTGAHLLSSISKGLLLTVDISLILFGAIFFVNFLKKQGFLLVMQSQLSSLSSDQRVQSILLVWLFGSFIEGIAGFGTSGAVIAPFLVAIGFTPITVILISLVANSTAVTFGAVGTPLRIGLAHINFVDLPFKTALINFLPGLLIPFFILWFINGDKTEKSWTYIKSSFSWCLFSGLAFLVPYLVTSFFDADYPSVIGGIFSLGLAILAIKRGYFFSSKQDVSGRSILKAFLPYLCVLPLLILGKFVFSGLNLKVDLGNGLFHNVQLFNPGFSFLTVLVLMTIMNRSYVKDLSPLLKETMIPLRKTFISIFFISSMTYLMVITNYIKVGNGMLPTLSQALIGPYYSYGSVFIGCLGAFLAGSATVSNLLFGEMHALAISQIDVNPVLIYSLQLTGAAAGNMISLPNILAVQTAVGEVDKEGITLRKLILPCFVYMTIAMLMGHVLAIVL